MNPLDPGTALVVVDLQQATVRNPLVHPVQDVVRNAAALARAFRARGLAVVLAHARLDAPPPGRTTVGGGRPPVRAELLELVPELEEQPGDLRVEHRGWSAFTGTDLAARLRDRGVTQVVVAGLATSFGVESTARSAYDSGFHVTVVADATSDLTTAGYERTIGAVVPVLGEVATTGAVLGALGVTAEG
ncbi:cysteine hydrolase [Cellulomonas sp. Marseille-Q8402]